MDSMSLNIHIALKLYKFKGFYMHFQKFLKTLKENKNSKPPIFRLVPFLICVFILVGAIIKFAVSSMLIVGNAH